jgi:hypothetical protein
MIDRFKKILFFSSAGVFASLTVAMPVYAANGYSWTPVSSNPYCYALVASATGQELACAPYYGEISISKDYGNTWTAEPSSGSTSSWYDIGMSATGQYLTAGNDNDGDYIYTSSDYGTTWTPNTNGPSADWSTASVSRSGQYQLIGGYSPGSIYLSSNYGTTWAQVSSLPTGNWVGSAMSASGQYMTVTNGGGDIYTSSNYGVTWASVASLGTENWEQTTISSSGQYMAAVVSGGDIYTSSNYGVTWVEQTGSGVHDWNSIISSGTGQELIAADDNNSGLVYESSDYGQTWSADNDLSSNGWYLLAGSSDLSRVAAMDNAGNIYLGEDPSLYVPPTSGSAVIPNSTTQQVSSTTGTEVLSPDTGYGRPARENNMVYVFGITATTSLITGSVLFFKHKVKQ